MNCEVIKVLQIGAFLVWALCFTRYMVLDFKQRKEPR